MIEIALLFLQTPQTFFLLLAEAFLFLAKQFVAFAAHLLRVVDAVQMPFVRVIGIGHGVIR
jgi:hypothetical protein